MGQDRIVPHDFRRELLMELFNVSSKRCALAYHDIEVYMSAAESTCARFRARGVNLTHIHLLVKAAALALEENPIFNSVITRSGILILDRVAIGVVNDVPARLPLVILEDAHLKSLDEVARELEESASHLEANEPKLLRRLDCLRHLPFLLRRLVIRYLGTHPPRALRELLPTFFVASLSSADSGFPLYGTTAYLFAGRILERPLLVKGQVAVKPTMCLTLVTDHRIIDGVPAASFLSRVKELMEQVG
jgi:pyruvate/2-oxoglutarate dehydrogenase complex dihydrolipoamide acyltransferase (E2) component